MASKDLDAFRSDASAWLETNFPRSLAGANPLSKADDLDREGTDAFRWKSLMGKRGWGTPTWPKTYGGGGLTNEEARVLQQEMSRAGAWNPIGGMGVMMFGPTLLEFGNEAQKQRHIPAIVTATLRWCQGYSEPGSGSDLASLQTRCEDAGDHFLINGQKIWTSGAHLADWCFCLVRTDRKKKHEGISFILIDMRTPGVEARPIKMISGASQFCETFFTDVKVPKENLVGPLNGGWTIAKRLLQFERQNISSGLGGGANAGGSNPSSVEQIAKRYVGLDSDGKLADADLRTRLVLHQMEARAFGLTIQRAAQESKGGQGPSAATSIMKYAGAKIAQERNELIVEAMGHSGLGWEGDGFTHAETVATKAWLRSKGNSIEGGSSEINLNVISKRVLGLLDHQ